MAKTKWQAAFARLCNYCKKHNEVAAVIADRHAKIEWIKREIKELEVGQLNRIVHEIKLLKG
ncbi:hypothetical protein [Campylobacter showae]|uniref:hypothetical protein n=1 Tax=Campylobacter showae TaxID=204 RepID=UPI0028D284D9|nr:hypothetical protein [Campylobacter showae]